MRGRGVALPAGALVAAGLALAGCARIEHPTAAPAPSASVPAGTEVFGAAPSPSPSPTPARAAGGTCRLLDYDSAQHATGTRFEVAAASTKSGAKTCALQVLYSEHPDLVVSVVGTEADVKAFNASAPDGAHGVDDLGKAAYTQVHHRDSGSDAGPAVEVTWLSGKGDIVNLRYTYPADVGDNTAGRAVDKLVAYARRIEARR